MSKPTRKRRLPEPVALAIAIVERVTGETLVECPKGEVKAKAETPHGGGSKGTGRNETEFDCSNVHLR